MGSSVRGRSKREVKIDQKKEKKDEPLQNRTDHFDAVGCTQETILNEVLRQRPWQYS